MLLLLLLFTRGLPRQFALQLLVNDDIIVKIIKICQLLAHRLIQNLLNSLLLSSPGNKKKSILCIDQSEWNFLSDYIYLYRI